jgi:hypothetical protein
MTYKSNGKLLLTGEYLVLQGALALALPLKVGQSMTVKQLPSNEKLIHWTAFLPNGKWFSASYDRKKLSMINTDDIEKGKMLEKILKAVSHLKPDAFDADYDLQFSTRLEFDSEWGLGSSSSLIANVSEWAEVNPYDLLNLTFGGSGYDIACAKAQKPIFFCLEQGKPVVEAIDFNPNYSNALYFVYQGKKQSSSAEVGNFKERMLQIDFQNDIDAVSEIGRSLAVCPSFDDFCYFLRIHEDIIAYCIDRKPLKNKFADFQGTIKSLGAWGGDFFLAATDLPVNQVKTYFEQKGLHIIFRYNDLVLNH